MNIVKLYESFIKDCINSNIKLYIVCSPYLIESNSLTNSVNLGKEIAAINKVLFFDFSEDSTFINNRKLFADIVHLNDEGAKIFSNMLLDSISKSSEITHISHKWE
jgi:hypothetical protein